MPNQSLWIRRGIVFVVDALLLFIAWRLAYDLRFGDELSLEINSPYQTQRNLLAPWVVLFQLGIFGAFRLYLTNFRYTGVPELKRLLMATGIGLGIFVLFNVVLERQEMFLDLPLADVTASSSHVLRVPWQVVPLYFIVGFLLTAGFRFSGRLWFESRNQVSPNAPATLIVGTSSNCLLLHRQIVRWSEKELAEARFRPVGFVVLDEAVVEKNIAGLECGIGLGSLPELLEKTDARVVLLSGEKASQKLLSEIVSLCKGKGIRLLVVPSLADIDDEKVQIRALKRVKIEDLLFRPTVDQLLPESRQYLRGKRVLVTGAGGSIGRELVRQILLNQPEVIILVGRGENSLHEVRSLFQDQQDKLTTVVCDVRQTRQLAEVFDRFRPEVVFHAAAHKHVSMMEQQPLEALSNNVVGTIAAAQLADDYECERFVLISTDKAVRPSSVMGASKRLAEEMVFSLAQESRTLFSVVRFGNVLGSRGSALRVFERQIEERLPITVTDPEATRFFMTVEEAVSLVLRAGSGQETGSLYLLEMGDAVKIGHLVESLLSLSGIPAAERPPIKIIGLQPGEKLHEELLTQEEDATATELEKVWKAKPRLFLGEKRNSFLFKLERLLDTGNNPLAIRFLMSTVPGYVPSGLIEPSEESELVVLNPKPTPSAPVVLPVAAAVDVAGHLVEEQAEEEPAEENEFAEAENGLFEDEPEQEPEPLLEQESDEDLAPEEPLFPEDDSPLVDESDLSSTQEILITPAQEPEHPTDKVFLPETLNEEEAYEDAPSEETSGVFALAHLAEQLEDALEHSTDNLLEEEAVEENEVPAEVADELIAQNPDEYIGDLFDSVALEPAEASEAEESESPFEPQELIEQALLHPNGEEQHLEEELIEEETTESVLITELAHSLESASQQHDLHPQSAQDEVILDEPLEEVSPSEPVSEAEPLFNQVTEEPAPFAFSPSVEESAEVVPEQTEGDSAEQADGSSDESTVEPLDPQPDSVVQELELAPSELFALPVQENEPKAEEALTPEASGVVDSTLLAADTPESALADEEQPASSQPEHPVVAPYIFHPMKDLINMSETSGIPCVFIALLDGVAPEGRKELFQHLATRLASTSKLFLTGVSDKSVVPESLHSRTTLLPASITNDAARFNAVIKASDEQALVITIGANVRLNMDFCDRIAEFAAKNPDAYVLYPNYIEEKNGKEETVKLHEHAGCPHERFDFGAMIIYRAGAVKEAGLFDESLKHAWEYDMHLKIMENGLIKNVPSVLYRHKIVEVADSQSGALHSPGRGKLGGFSYVFYPEDVEKEITTVFEKGLKRIGAWIDHDFADVPQPAQPTPVLASVVIPILNRVKYIENAINKVQNGTFQDFEVIIVDNGSTDGTIELIQRLAQQDSRIRLFHGTGGSIASALNHGIREARGKYICQLDSDDEYAPTTLEKMIGHLESNPKCGLAISYYRLMNEKGEILHDIAPITHSGYSRNQILRRDGGGAVRIFPKAVLVEFGYYDEVNYGNFGEDYDMVLKTGEKYSVDRVHEVLYHYRRHEDNTDVTRDPEMKYKNKNRSRQEALRRRMAINKALNK